MSQQRPDMLRSFISVANYVNDCDNRDSTDSVKVQLSDWVKAAQDKIDQLAKEQRENVLSVQKELEKAKEKISFLEEEQRRLQKEKQQIEKNFTEMEGKLKEQEGRMRKMNAELDHEQWEKFELNGKIQNMTTCLTVVYKALHSLTRDQLKQLFPKGGAEIGMGPDDNTVEMVQNLKSNFAELEKLQKQELEELAQLLEGIDSFRPSYKKKIASNESSVAVAQSQLVGGREPAAKKIRFDKTSGTEQSQSLKESEPSKAILEFCDIIECVQEPEVIILDDEAAAASSKSGRVLLEPRDDDQDTAISQFLELSVDEDHGLCQNPPPENAEANPDGTKKFWCICGKGYSKKNDLGRHILCKEKGKIFKCPLCTKSFTLHKSVKRHVRKHHKIQYEGGNYGCRVCGTTYKMAKDLYHHRKSEHPGMLQFPFDSSPDGKRASSRREKQAPGPAPKLKSISMGESKKTRFANALGLQKQCELNVGSGMSGVNMTSDAMQLLLDLEG